MEGINKLASEVKVMMAVNGVMFMVMVILNVVVMRMLMVMATTAIAITMTILLLLILVMASVISMNSALRCFTSH